MVDTTPPVITLLGPAALKLEKGTAFSDPGAIATDTCAGDLTGAISVSGTIDACVLGSQSLRYSAPTAPGGLDQYIRTALELRPEFSQLKSGLVARQLLVDAAKADRYPSFFLAVVGQVAGAPGRKYNPDPYVNDFFND